MYSKFQFDNKWRVGGDYTIKLVSQSGLNIQVIAQWGTGLFN